MKHPDLRTMLPSKERAYLIDALFKLLEEAKVNFFADPIFREADALIEFRDVPGTNSEKVLSAYEYAKKLYDQKHPKTWSNELQRASRAGIPEEQHIR